MAAESRKQIIEQLKNLKLIHEKTVSIDTLSGASLKTLNAILEQVKKNGPKSEKAKQMVKNEAMSTGGKKAAEAVQVQLNDQQIADKLSGLGDIQIQLKSGQFSEEADTLRKQIQGIIKACQQGDTQATKLVKSLDIKKLKGLKDNASLIKQFGKQADDAHVHLYKFSKTSQNLFSKCPIGPIKKLGQSFNDTKDDIAKTAWQFRDFKKSIKSIKLEDLKKGLNFTNVSASAITAIKGLDAFYHKIDQVTTQIINYHKSTQVIGASNSDLMPGGAKQLDSIRRNMNLTRKETVQFANTVSQLRTTTYSVDDLTKAMQGMKQTLGQVDPSKLKDLASIMQSIPKDQLDAFTSGTGGEGDTMNAIMAMQKSGQTEKVLQLGASGAFGSQFAQASGVKINQNQKAYVNNKRAVTTAKQTLQNKTQQTLSNTPVVGKMLASTPFASAAAPLSGIAQTVTSLFGAFSKDKKSEQSASIGQNSQKSGQGTNQTSSGSKTPQKKQQSIKKDQKKTKQTSNKDQLLKSIDAKIGALLKKKFEVSSVGTVKKVEHVKSVGKIKQLQFIRSIKKVDTVYKVNGSGTSAGKGGGAESVVSKTVEKLTQTVKGKIGGSLGQAVKGKSSSGLGQRSASDSSASLLGQRGKKLFNSVLGQRKSNSGSKGSFAQDVGGLVKKIIGSKDGSSEGFDLSSFFNGKLSDYLGNGKLQDIIKPQNISNLIKGKFDFKQLSNLKYLKNLKNLKSLTQLKNLKGLLNLRHLKGGKTALKVAGLAHKGYKAYKAARAAHGIGKAALIGGKVALGAGVKGALASTGVGLPAAAAMHIAQSAVGGAINAYQDNAAAKNIKKQMGIQQYDAGLMGRLIEPVNQFADAVDAVINPIGLFTRNLTKTGSVSKAFNGTLSQVESAWKGFAQTFTFGLYKEDPASKKQRQLNIAANTQTQYSAQGFKQIYKINERVNQIKKENMKRNMYMAKQYAGFSKKLDLIKGGAYTLQERLKEQVALTKMENSFRSGANNSDYGTQSSNMIAASTKALEKDLQELSKMKSSVMRDDKLTDAQRTVELLQIQQAQIQARKKFVENLKRALDCRNIPSVIQNSFKTMINNARIQSATAGYGGDDDAMFEAMGANIHNAMEDFAATSKFNAQAFSKVKQANAKNLENSMKRLNDLGSSASSNASMAQVVRKINDSKYKSNLVGENDGGDIKGSQMGQIADRKLTDKEIQALQASGLAEKGNIATLKKGTTLSEIQLDDSYSQSSKQEGIKKLMQRFESQRKSGDVQGAKATVNILKGLHTALKGRGASTQFLDSSMKTIQQAASSIGNIKSFKDESGVDYSLSSDQQNMQQAANQDAKFKKLLSQRGLLDANGNVSNKQQDKQAVRQAYMDRKAQVGMEGSYKQLMKNKDFAKLVKDNGGDKQAAFRQFSSQLQQKSSGLQTKEFKAATSALDNAVKSGQVTDELKNNKGNIEKILQSGMKNAKTKQDKDKIQSGKDALAKLNSGQKLSVQQRKQLLAKLKQANQLVGVLGTSMDAETRAAYQNITTLQAYKNSQVKSVQILADVFKNQKDSYVKLIGAIQSLQNAIAKSSNVKRAQLKSDLQKSKSALVQFGGGDVGANLASVYKSSVGVSQAKIGAGKKALTELKNLAPQMEKMVKQGGNAFNGQIEKMFSGKDKKIGQMSVAKQDGKDVSFIQALKDIGDQGSKGALEKNQAKQEQARKKINERQKQLIQANKKSGGTQQQRNQRQTMIKAKADLARQMIGTGGTVQGVKMKLQTGINNALAQQITALKNFGSSLKTASNSLTSLQASARKSQMASKQKLLKKKLGSNVQSLDIMQQQSQASQQQYKQKKKLQQTKIKVAEQNLADAQNKYNANPSQANEEELKKAKFALSSAQQGMNAIQTQQYQSANQAVAGALQLVATKAQLAQQSLSIMQDAAQNVAGTTAQWYKLQNEKLSVMAQQVQGIRNVIKSKAFEKLSAQQQAKYKNDLAKKELALAKQRIGAQRTVFEKQLGAIVGGLQSQGAFQGFNNAAVFGIGHGVNQAGMAVQRKNMQGGGYDVKTLGRQSRTQYQNQGNTSMQNAGQNAVKMGTPQASNLTRTKNADGSYSYMDQGTGKMVQVGSSVKKDSDGNAIFKRDANGKLVTNDKGQLVAQTDPQAQKKAKQAQAQAEQDKAKQTGQKAARPDAIPQDNQTKKQQQQKKAKQKKKDLGKSDHQIYVDILGTVKQILDVLQSGFSTSAKDKNVKTGAFIPPASNQNGQQVKDGQQQQSDSKGIKSQSKASGKTESNAASTKKQSASGNAATAPSQATAKTPQDEQLQNLLDVRNDQTFAQKSKEQQQQINSRIAQLQAKKNSKSSNGGVASSDKKIAGAGSQSVDQGKVTPQGTLKQFKQDVIENPLLKASDQQIELQNKNKQIVSHIDQKQQQVASNKQKIAASKALLNDKDALDKTALSSFDAKKGVLSDLQNLYDKKSQFAELTSLAVNGGHDAKNVLSNGTFSSHGFNLSSDQLRTIGAKNTAQLADWEQNRNVYRQHDAKIFAQMEDPSKAISKGKLKVYKQALRRKQFYQAIDSFDPDKRQQFYQDSIKSDSENIQARRTQLIDKKIAHAKQDAKSLGYSQSDISSTNIQGTAKGLTFEGQKARIQGQAQKNIDSLSMKNSQNALDIQQSNQILKGNLRRVNQLKTNQAVNILSGNNKNATVQDKQKAIDFWNENGIKTQASQDIVDNFVRQSVRRGQKFNFDKKIKGQYGIEYQKNTRQNKVASNQMAAMTKQQLNVQNDKKVKAMKQKAGVATETIEKYQGQLDQLEKNPNENKRKIETVKRKIAEAQKVLQQNGTQAQQKQALGDQQLRSRLQQKGIDTSTLSNYDLQNQKAKILLDQKQKQAQEKASAASAKLAKNPNDEKAKKELQEANANVEKVKKERSDFQANIQRGRQIAVQQTNASNAKKLVQMSNQQIMSEMKDAKLAEVNKRIQEGSKYQNVKKAMLAKGMTQQQFQQKYGKEGTQTQQQFKNMQLYKQQFKRNQFKGVAEQFAKSQFDKNQNDIAKKAAIQGNFVRKKTWNKLNQSEKQAYIQEQMPNAQKQIQQATDRQLQRQKKQQILQQNKDLVQQKKASMLSSDNYDETRKQAVEFYKSKGIDLNGGNEQQQKALIQQFAQRQAQQQVVDNEIDFARQKQNVQSYSREPMDYHAAQYGVDYEPYGGNQELIPYQFNAQSTPQAVQHSVITPPSTGQTENTQYLTQTKLNNAGAATNISQQSHQQKITPVTVAQPKQNVGITNTTTTNSAPTGNGFTFNKNIQTQVSPYGLPAVPGDGKLELIGLQKMFRDMIASLMNSADKQAQTNNYFS